MSSSYGRQPEDAMSKMLEETHDAWIDNESIKKRFVTFRESSMPVVEFYEKLGKVRKVNAVDTTDKVCYKDQKFRVVRLRKREREKERERESPPLCVGIETNHTYALTCSRFVHSGGTLLVPMFSPMQVNVASFVCLPLKKQIPFFPTHFVELSPVR